MITYEMQLHEMNMWVCIVSFVCIVWLSSVLLSECDLQQLLMCATIMSIEEYYNVRCYVSHIDWCEMYNL